MPQILPDWPERNIVAKGRPAKGEYLLAVISIDARGTRTAGREQGGEHSTELRNLASRGRASLK